jgi:hypothetical protein
MTRGMQTNARNTTLLSANEFIAHAKSNNFRDLGSSAIQ